ncbi:MAG TPA: dUTP diphosphatase [Caulobacteraceae bacterium]
MTTELRVRRLPHFEGLDLPAYQTEGSAGMDVRAAVPEDAPVLLAPGQRAMIPTGIAMAVPPGFECQVRPRSGLAVKHGISCVNTPGTIDSDYRGEVHVVLVNLGQEPFEVRRGERIAQLVIARYERVAVSPVESLDETGRGAGGFGSTGRG